jgi:regulator of sigma E protease
MFLQFALVILSIQIIILIHECGHFFCARSLGFQVTNFNIGFGKKLFSINILNTLFAIRLIPLGGYVSIKNLSFQNEQLSECLKIWVMGPIFNFIAAIIVFMIILTNDFYELKPRIESPGLSSVYVRSIDGNNVYTWEKAYSKLISNLFWNKSVNVILSNQESIDVKLEDINFKSTKPILDQMNLKQWRPKVTPIIEYSNIPEIKKGDSILGVDNIVINQWSIFKHYIKKSPGKVVQIKVIRGNKLIITNVLIQKKFHTLTNIPYGYLPVEAKQISWPKNEIINSKSNVFTLLNHSLKRFIAQFKFQLTVFSSIFIGNVPFEAFTGPIGIGSIILQSINSSFLVFLYTFCIINISIGIINLLPLPGLDGGQMIIAVINKLIGYKITLRWVRLLERITLIVFFILLVKITLLDIEKYLLYISETTL